MCEKWFHKNIVLIGDAAHTAHFGIGSGTKLAMEDAMALARVLSKSEGDVHGALAQYQEEREIEALKLQSAARNRMEWFEQVERYVHLEPEQFAYSLLTGSQRIGHENLKLRDASYVEGVERWFAERSGDSSRRPADVHAVQVRGHDSQESRHLSRPWRRIWRWTAFRTIFIWCIWARAPWAERPWW